MSGSEAQDTPASRQGHDTLEVMEVSMGGPMKFYVEWKDATDPYDEWVSDGDFAEFKTFKKAVKHCLEAMETYTYLEHRIRIERKGHKPATIAKFNPFPFSEE